MLGIVPSDAEPRDAVRDYVAACFSHSQRFSVPLAYAHIEEALR